MKLLRGRTGAVLIIVVILSLLLPVAASAVSVGGAEITSAGAFVMDYDTGIELYGHNADTLRVPASMTKLLAAYVIYDAIKAGEISYSTVATISQSVSTFSNNREWSNVPMAAGAGVTVDKLLDFVIVYSACAATDALAEVLCGSVSAFVKRMNDKVAQLGINAVFYDTFGGSANNRITPRGMAILAKNLITDYPNVLIKATMPSTSYNGVTYNNTNRLLGVYDGIDGLKTGYTGAAGYCFIATAVRNGRRLISVTMGSSSVSTRFPDTTALLDYGFSVIENANTNVENENPVSSSGNAYPASSNIIVNGTAASLSFFNINDYHYFKLRDIAYLLAGTEKEFEALWDNDLKTVFMTSGIPYTVQGDELSPAANAEHKYTATSSEIYLDYGLCGFDVYNINDYNYFKLRDIAALFDFGVEWDNETHTVYIDTTRGYETGASEPEESEPVEPYEPEEPSAPVDPEEPSIPEEPMIPMIPYEPSESENETEIPGTPDAEPLVPPLIA